jgi:hypothetical protein
MLKYSLTGCLLVCLGLVLPACAADIGEACETRGSQDECVDGAICDLEGTTSATEPVCLKVCKEAAECASTEDCNGVSDSNIKACTPKKK